MSDEPVAYAFEMRGNYEDYTGEWNERVSFTHPTETYVKLGGIEVRNVRPLYEGDP